jgi:type IV pilus assembly protein PilA
MQSKKAFTLVEVMIVVAIIALLTAIAIPWFQRYREDTLNSRFANDLRIACHAIRHYHIKTVEYPPDRTPRIIPAGMAGYLAGMEWSERTPIGGWWDWDYQQFGCTAGVSVYRPDRDDRQMTEIDKLIDDGDLATGSFRKRNQGYIYIIEP